MKEPHGPLDLFSLEELADAIVCTDDESQATFLNAMGRRFKQEKWGEQQQCYLADALNNDGVHLVYTLSNFRKVKGIHYSSPKYAPLLDTYDNMSVDALAPIKEEQQQCNIPADA